MVLAEQKLKSNIAEYVIFMWQMEDLVRAVYFDPDALDEFIRTYTPEDTAYQAEKKWFENLIRKMKSERVEQRGHIAEVHEVLFELGYLHNTLLNVVKDAKYAELYRLASPNIKEYQERSAAKAANDVETCLTGLYGLLVLRLKKEPISIETQEAMKSFSDLMAHLALYYKRMKSGEMNFNLN